MVHATSALLLIVPAILLPYRLWLPLYDSAAIVGHLPQRSQFVFQVTESSVNILEVTQDVVDHGRCHHDIQLRKQDDSTVCR